MFLRGFGVVVLAGQLGGFSEGVGDRGLRAVRSGFGAELDADELADPVFFHRDPVEHVRAADRALVVGDDDELALADKAVEDFDEPADVRFVEGGVHFVQHAERARLDHVDREQQRDGGHRAFTAREEAHALELLAGRLGDDLDARLERVAVVHEHEVRAPSAEELGEHLLEIHADFFERLCEQLFGRAVDFGDDLEQLRLRVHEVGVLLFEEDVALFELVELLDGIDIDRPHGFDPLGQLGDDFLDAVPRDPFAFVGLGQRLRRRLLHDRWSIGVRLSCL